jgi:uncharacterized SAM-binding protein YcdF (DUF218 family)
MSQSSYFLSTLFIAVLSPLGLYLAAILLLAVLPRRVLAERRRRTLFFFLTALFALSCTPYAGKSLLKLMESLCPAEGGPDASRPAVILILGGGSVAEGDAYQPSISSQRRMRQGIKLAQSAPSCVILLTGIESPLMSRWLKSRCPDAEILQESRSLNTEGNMRLSAALLEKRWPDKTGRPVVMIVTDRFHMARTLIWAGKYLQGFDILPAPAPSLVRQSRGHPESLIPTSKGLELTSMAWRELLAYGRDLARE